MVSPTKQTSIQFPILGTKPPPASETGPQPQDKTMEPNKTFQGSITTFVVEGSGRFPIDMLRYNQAWPATVQAGIDITTTEPHDDLGNRTVRLNATQQPTIGRWASFGWQVISISPMPSGEAREQVIKNAARTAGFQMGAK